MRIIAVSNEYFLRIIRASAVLVLLITCHLRAVDAVPDRLVVLTFDDSVASQATRVAPLLTQYGFGATFFITEGFEFADDKTNYMTWDQIAALHAAGFEIGNHTRHHTSVSQQQPAALEADVAFIEMQCTQHGIPRPMSFCYPGYQTSPAAVTLLRARGYRLRSTRR
jgi:peptidoglycan/xylan/chitin deacetylase (PgdA/CDA1 family)